MVLGGYGFIDGSFGAVEDSADSILAMVAGVLAPIFKPIGLGDWRICTALISGFMAKESVVSTLEVLFSGNIASVLTPLAAASLLVFSLLYTPCVAAIASIKREMGSKWAVGVVVWQCVIAWGGCTDRTSDRDDLILLIRFYRKTDGFDCFQSSPSVFSVPQLRGFYLISTVRPGNHWTSVFPGLRSFFFIIISEQLSLNFQFEGR